MRDISDKFTSLRTARAQACLIADTSALQKLAHNDLPKSDPLIVARCAGIQAAKNTALLIPACHQVPLDYVAIDFEVDPDAGSVTITAEVKAEYKTGVEMEALTAASVAALTLYDMLKPICDDMTISFVRLESKTGGTRAQGICPDSGRSACVIVASDSVAQGTRTDTSGACAQALLTTYGFAVESPVVVPDDSSDIAEAITRAAGKGMQLVLLSGGTGPGPRDVTASVVRELCHKILPGMGEWARAYGRTRTANAILSDSCAGIYENALVIALPGSTNAVRESLTALQPVLHHTCAMIAGHGHDHV